MGLFGSLIGWDQSMGANNAVLASYLLENSDSGMRKAIALQVADIIMSVQRTDRNSALAKLSEECRVTQMNFVAIACDNLGIPPPVANNVWSRLKNPYMIGTQVDETRIKVALGLLLKQDRARIEWPGNDSKVDFLHMFRTGELRQSGKQQGSQEVGKHGYTRAQMNQMIEDAAFRFAVTHLAKELEQDETEAPSGGDSQGLTKKTIEPETEQKPRVLPPAFTEKPRTVLSASDREKLSDLKAQGWNVAFNGVSWTLAKDGQSHKVNDAQELQIFWKNWARQ